MVMASGFGPEGPHSTSDTAKDPPSACGVRARKITCSLPWVLSLEKISLPFRDIYKLRRWTMDGAAICRREAEIGLLLLINRPANSGVTYLLCLKPCTGPSLPSDTSQQQ